MISHLSISDLLMGISLLMLAISDAYYGELFPSYTHMWTQGWVCKVIGFLSIVSNEASVFLITLISIDRYLAIKYPFGGQSLTVRTSRVSVLFVWLLSMLMGTIVIGSGEKSEIFTTSEVCSGIPIIRPQETKIKTNRVLLSETNFLDEYHYRMEKSAFVTVRSLDNITSNTQMNYKNVSYPKSEIIGSKHSPILSILIFIVVNSVCFIVVTVCYVEIFRTATNSSQNVTSTQNSKSELRMARKMFLIVFTDFCCWVPLCFACILAQFQVITISPEIYAWIIGFILPINSTINPIVYVIQDEISDYLKKKKNLKLSNSRQIGRSQELEMKKTPQCRM